MKSESVEKVSAIMQIGADLGLSSFELNAIVIAAAVVLSMVFASYAQRWI